MLNVNNYGNTGELAATAEATDTSLVVRSFDAPKFNTPAGSHYYLTIRQDARREVVLVTGVLGTNLTVVRAEDGTTAQRFTAGACITVEWNPAQLLEFLGAGPGGCTAVPGVAGTYCLGCTTCITVDGCGRVTQVNGAGGCNG